MWSYCNLNAQGGSCGDPCCGPCSEPPAASDFLCLWSYKFELPLAQVSVDIPDARMGWVCLNVEFTFHGEVAA